MNEDPNGPHDPKPSTPTAPEARQVAGGCLSAFVMLWGLAFLLVGMLIAAVSGYCSFVFIVGGGSDPLGFRVMFVVGCIIGIILCIGGYFMMRRGLDR